MRHLLAFDWHVAARLKRTMSFTSWSINPCHGFGICSPKPSNRARPGTAHARQLLQGALGRRPRPVKGPAPGGTKILGYFRPPLLPALRQLFATAATSRTCSQAGSATRCASVKSLGGFSSARSRASNPASRRLACWARCNPKALSPSASAAHSRSLTCAIAVGAGCSNRARPDLRGGVQKWTSLVRCECPANDHFAGQRGKR